MIDIFSMIGIFNTNVGTERTFLIFTVTFELLGIIFFEILLAAVITLVLLKFRTKINAIKIIDHIIVNHLVDEVVTTLKSVDILSLLNTRLLKISILLVLITGFTIIYITDINYHTGISPEVIVSAVTSNNSSSNSTIYPVVENGGTSNNVSDNSNSSLYGPPQVIVVQGKPVDLTIPPGTGQGFTNQQDANQTNHTFIQSAPIDPTTIAAPSYTETLPEGYDNTIKSYFEQLDNNSSI
jgi:Leucine-rich repeat (LRR) protein